MPELYAGRGAVLYDEATRSDRSEVRELVNLIRGTDAHVLELAAGSGRLTIPLARVARSVIAVDISDDLLDLLDHRLIDGEVDNVDVLRGDLFEVLPRLRLREPFDVVVLGTTTITLFNEAQRSRLYALAADVLAPDGRLVVSFYEASDDESATQIDRGRIAISNRLDAARGVRVSTISELSGDGTTIGRYSGETFLLTAAALHPELRAAQFSSVRSLPVRSGFDKHLLFIAERDDEGEPGSALAEFFLPVDRWGDPANEAVAAQGSHVTFADGSEAVCAVSGLWNTNLGYGDPVVADAIDRVNRTASALPVFRRGSRIAREAAEALLGFARPHRFRTAWFSTSGSAALDMSLKLIRQFHALGEEPRRRRIVSFVGSYHGMTMGAMAVTGEYLLQDVYAVDQRLHIKIPHDDIDALDRVMARYGTEVAAMIIEPVLGSGTLVVPGETIERVLEHRQLHGFQIVADEVATGFHRTGPRFASHLWSEQPDALVMSKALTNGTSASAAVLVTEEIVNRFRRSGAVFCHGETQAASPQSSAATLATIRRFAELDVATHQQHVAATLDQFIGRMLGRSARFGADGRGCFRSLSIRDEDGELIDGAAVASIVADARRAGVLVQPGPGRVQIVPNLMMSDADLELMETRLTPVLLAAVNIPC